jgi:hypothetical protein
METTEFFLFLVAQFDPRTGNSTGAAFVMSPVAAAVGVD